MKNTITKIILSAIICLSAVGFAGAVEAASFLYVSPATLTKTAGDVFTTSVGFSASGNKVCAVEGTLVFNGLTCQSITVASDVMAQSSPTCSNLHFLIGIPNCATSDKILMTVSARAGNAGTASISAVGVDIIGEGSSVGSTSINGSYKINAIPVPTPTPTPTPAPKTAEKTTPKAEQTATAPESAIETGDQPDDILTASLAGSGNNLSTFFAIIGGWLLSNIIWIIVLILATAGAFIAGRISCKKNTKDFITNLWKKK